MSEQDIHTLISEALAGFDDPHGSIVPGIQLATTFERDENNELIGDFVYRRNSSPTVRDAEKAMATIDGGEESLLFASGMAAVTALMGSLAPGSRVVAPEVMYHGAHDWLRRLDGRGQISLTVVNDMTDDGLARAVGGGVDLVWIETPANPTWDVFDIAAAAEVTHAEGGILAVDSTVAPAVTTRPLELGADIVFQSATKYLNGHSDVTAGVLTTQRTTELWNTVGELRLFHGSVISPFDVWLLLRGLRTLGVRYERASGSALSIARAMESQDGVAKVFYPGLESHPQHSVARRQMTGGYGGMLSILIDGTSEQTRRAATATALLTTATSLGGTESLIEHRAAVEGPHSVVPENLLRISVGLEDPNDLIADLGQAIEKAMRV